MKYPFLIIAILVTSFTSVLAQSPGLINYQSVVRDDNGQVLSDGTPVDIKFSIREGSATGTVVYTETQSLTTNAFGLINTQIGSVTAISGVDWGNADHFLQVEVDINSSGSFTDMGTTQMVSVPYAMYANTSGDNSWQQSGNDISNVNTGNVGIGTASPATKLDVNGQVKISGGSPGAGKVLTSDANGVASWQSLPSSATNVAFDVYQSTTQTITGGPTTVQIEFGAEEYDMGNNFSSNEFTAPADGLYQFNSAIRLDGANAEGLYTWLAFYVNGSLYKDKTGQTNDDTWGLSISSSIMLEAGDVVSVRFFTDQSSITTVDGSFNSWFNGHQVW